MLGQAAKQRFSLVLAVMVISLTLTTAAHAEDREAAKAAFSDGKRYYDLTQYSDALAAFKKAYWNYEAPVFLFNIAQCERALGHKIEAVKIYRSYLRNEPTAPNRADVEAIIANLDKAIALEQTTRSGPPEGTLSSEGPAATTPSVATPAIAPVQPLVVQAAVDISSPAKTPVYKKWWLWTVVGVAVVGVGLGVGLGLGLQSHNTFPGVTF